jgi:hypothetical protein
MREKAFRSVRPARDVGDHADAVAGPSDRPLTLRARKHVFRELVLAQDSTLGDLTRSRRIVAALFGLSTSNVRAIENEGVANDWPLPPPGTTR